MERRHGLCTRWGHCCRRTTTPLDTGDRSGKTPSTLMGNVNEVQPLSTACEMSQCRESPFHETGGYRGYGGRRIRSGGRNITENYVTRAWTERGRCSAGVMGHVPPGGAIERSGRIDGPGCVPSTEGANWGPGSNDGDDRWVPFRFGSDTPTGRAVTPTGGDTGSVESVVI